MPNPFFSQQGVGPKSQTRPDALKVTKSSLRFGPLTFSRVNTVPPMDHGRPGDVVLVDNTDSPSIILQTEQTPTSVGLWMKLPIGYATAPTGNVVTGYPAGKAAAGDILMINSILVPLTAPYTATSVADDINNTGIPNVSASIAGEALIIAETTGGELTITDTKGSATVGLGIYSQRSLVSLAEAGIVVNGVWMPVGDTAASGGPSAATAATYLTLTPDAALPEARTLTAGDGIKLTDDGPGGSLTVEHDIEGVTPLSEPLEPTDKLLIYNTSSGEVEKISVADIATAAGGVSITEAVQQRSVVAGTAGTYDVGSVIPAGAIVRSTALEIVTPYSAGTTIEIGDAGNPSRLMTIDQNDPEEVNIYETSAILDYITATQVVMTVNGAPTTGAGRVIIDYIVP